LFWSEESSVEVMQRLPHLVVPLAQVKSQEPFTQTAVALAPGLEHWLPQAEQLAGSLESRLHCPPQFEKPELQLTPHWPLVQVATPFAGAGQTWPTDPQFATSEPVWTQSEPEAT
jgi:hypothetical protein